MSDPNWLFEATNFPAGSLDADRRLPAWDVRYTGFIVTAPPPPDPLGSAERTALWTRDGTHDEHPLLYHPEWQTGGIPLVDGQPGLLAIPTFAAAQHVIPWRWNVPALTLYKKSPNPGVLYTAQPPFIPAAEVVVGADDYQNNRKLVRPTAAFGTIDGNYVEPGYWYRVTANENGGYDVSAVGHDDVTQTPPYVGGFDYWNDDPSPPPPEHIVWNQLYLSVDPVVMVEPTAPQYYWRDPIRDGQNGGLNASAEFGPGGGIYPGSTDGSGGVCTATCGVGAEVKSVGGFGVWGGGADTVTVHDDGDTSYVWINQGGHGLGLSAPPFPPPTPEINDGSYPPGSLWYASDLPGAGTGSLWTPTFWFFNPIRRGGVELRTHRPVHAGHLRTI